MYSLSLDFKLGKMRDLDWHGSNGSLDCRRAPTAVLVGDRKGVGIHGRMAMESRSKIASKQLASQPASRESV